MPKNSLFYQIETHSILTNLLFEPYNFKIKSTPEGLCVWDIVRKKYLLITPEEKVRQTILHYLVFTQKIGVSLLAVERNLNKKDAHRFDIVLFDRRGKPLLLVECKAPTENIGIDTLLQSAHYNTYLHSPFIWLTNGAINFVFQQNDQTPLAEMPNFLAYL